MSISLQLKNKPIILKYSKQGMPGRTGAQGLPGEDATNWEVSLSMEGVSSGTGTIRLYKDGEICSQEIHYAEIFVMPLNRREYIRSNTLSRTISGTYIFQYTNVRSILVIIWEDSSQEKVLCADSVANFRGRDLRVLQLPAQSFTTAEWQTYGAPGYTRTWITGAEYDNTTLENGDLVLIPGTVTDQRDQQDNLISGFILGTVVIPDGGSAESSVQVISRAFFIGPAGAAATIRVGSVATLPAGSNATVVNSGTANNAVLDFGIPEGQPGSIANTIPFSNITGDPADNAALVAELAKYLLLTGGTLTGALTIKNWLNLQNPEISYDTTPTADVWGRPLSFTIGDGTPGQVRMIYRKNGSYQLHMGTAKKVNDETVENYIRLTIASDGTLSVGVSDKDAWRNAIGASSGIWPTSVGGTGGTDSGWKTLTNSSVFSGTIYYRKIGQWVEVTSHELNLTSALTSTAGVTLTTIPSGYRTTKVIANNAGSTFDNITIRFHTDGGIGLFKSRNSSSLPTTAIFYVSAMYFIG